jgi:predicted nucleic acid-binding Zn ribbon protein
MSNFTLSTSRLIALGEPEANEHNAIVALDQLLDPDWIIFHSRKSLRDRPDIDVLIVTPDGVFAVELKYYRDTLRIGNGAHWQRQLANGSTEQIPNMLQGQAQKRAQQLKAELKAVAGLHHVWIEPVVIFTHASSYLQFETRDGTALEQVVFCLRDAKIKLEFLAAENRKKMRQPLSRVDLEKIADTFDVVQLLPATSGWNEESPAAPRPKFVKSEDRMIREKRRRNKQAMAILTLVGALLVTIAIYLVVMEK